MLSIILVSALCICQPPMVKTLPVTPPDSYETALNEAQKNNQPLVIFLRHEGRPAKNAVTIHLNNWLGDTESKILFTVDHKQFYRLLPDGDLQTEIQLRRKVVSIGKTPFAEPDDKQVGRSSPWIEDAEIRASWPKTVNFPNTLRFYILKPRYQNLYTMNNGTFKGRDIDPLHHEDENLTVSGGLLGLHNWRSVKGLDLKGKKIKVWEEDTDVRAFSLVPRWRWSYPEGSVAYDVLYHQDKIFEIRTQEKLDEGWRTKILFKDLNNQPEGYKTVNNCNSCHSKPATVVSVPGRIYLRSIWGDDGRFSWRPFDDQGQLDRRWPIE